MPRPALPLTPETLTTRPYNAQTPLASLAEPVRSKVARR